MPLYLVGLDGSPSSVKALRYAVGLASTQGAEIRTLTTWDVPTAFGEYSLTDWNPEENARTTAREALRDAFGADVPPNVRSDVRQGSPAQSLLEESATADLLVVGSRGHGGFTGLLLGSVSATVAAHATIPVLVVH